MKRTLKILTISVFALLVLTVPLYGFGSELIMELSSSGSVIEVPEDSSEFEGELGGEVSGEGDENDFTGSLDGTVVSGSGGGSGTLSGFVTNSGGGSGGSLSSFSSFSESEEENLAFSPVAGGDTTQETFVPRGNGSLTFSSSQGVITDFSSDSDENLALAESDSRPSLGGNSDSLALGDDESLLLAAMFSTLSLGTGNLLFALLVSLILVMSLGYYLFVIRT